MKAFKIDIRIYQFIQLVTNMFSIFLKQSYLNVLTIQDYFLLERFLKIFSKLYKTNCDCCTTDNHFVLRKHDFKTLIIF